MLKNVVNFGSIAKLTLCSLMVGLGFGLATRFFNVFYDLALGASDRQISAVFAVGALAGAVAILFSGVFIRRWGRIRSIAATQLVSVPFLMLMVFVPLLVPGLPLVVAFFLIHEAFYSIAMPIRNQLSMELTVTKERGTTAGMTHMSFDLGGAFGAGMSGILIGAGAAEVSQSVGVGEFVPAFTVAALLVVSAAILYYVFFRGWEARQTRPTVAALEVG
jgi:MFS family permease